MLLINAIMLQYNNNNNNNNNKIPRIIIPISRAVARTYIQGCQAEDRRGQANCKNISMYIV